MTKTTVAKPAAKTVKPLITTSDRKRFSFGPVWNAAVLAGKITDQEKLVAHAVKLKVGAKSDIKRLKFDTLLAKVTAALQAAPADEPTATTDAPAAE